MSITLLPGNIAFDWKLGQASTQFFILSVSPTHVSANTICDKKLVFETKLIGELQPAIQCVANYIYRCGLWFYFEDETSALEGPYDSIKSAIEALHSYVAFLNAPKPDPKLLKELIAKNIDEYPLILPDPKFLEGRAVPEIEAVLAAEEALQQTERENVDG